MRLPHPYLTLGVVRDYCEGMKFYMVGGAVRDELLGVEPKDIDYAVELEPGDYSGTPSDSCTGPFDAMRQGLLAKGYKIFLEKPEFLTIRAKAGGLTTHASVVDFVLCRKDSASGDGRRPDFVEPGTIFDDLARRDFTVNAMARDLSTGELIDPHDGKMDLAYRSLRFVGDPMTRIREDGLRVMRALRFSVTKDFSLSSETLSAVHHEMAAEMLMKVSVERIREELEKMVSHDSLATINLLSHFGLLGKSIFRDGLRFMATLKK